MGSQRGVSASSHLCGLVAADANSLRSAAAIAGSPRRRVDPLTHSSIVFLLLRDTGGVRRPSPRSMSRRTSSPARVCVRFYDTSEAITIESEGVVGGTRLPQEQ
jgi:hypothetical protein